MKEKTKKKGGVSIGKLMPIITILVALLYAIGAYFLLFVPKLSSVVEGGRYDTTQLDARVLEDKAYLSTLKAAGATLARVNPEHKKRVTGIIPLEPDVPGIFVELDALAKTNQMVLVSIDTVIDEKAPSPIGMKTVRVAVNLAGGTYEQMLRFLGDVERTLRITDVRTITFTPGTGTYGIALTTYFLDKTIVLGGMTP